MAPINLYSRLRGHHCFFGCMSLTLLTFEPGSKLTRLGSKAFFLCWELNSICIPASVEMLCESCFSGRSDIASLTFELGSRLTRIESKAFLRCYRLKSICIPASVEGLCWMCFAKCESLSPVLFERGSKLRRIEPYAFYGCSSLKSVSIPFLVRFRFCLLTVSLQTLRFFWRVHSLMRVRSGLF
jgi:hypothetical protein